jgi:ABC-type lipoprotein export system ATPase subunit
LAISFWLFVIGYSSLVVGQARSRTNNQKPELYMTDSPYIVETQSLTRIYGNGEEIRALDDVNLTIDPGELVAVMGPSGSGKSTLLNVLGALDRPTSGKVFVNGQDLAKIRNHDRFRAQTVGFVFQLHNLLPTLNAVENVEVPMMGYLGPLARRKRAKELLDLVGLSTRMNHLPGQLSGGQRQRVAVARALANKAPLILADEPTGNLDSVAGNDLMNLIRDLNTTQGVTFVIVTHDLNVARQTRRVLVMADGKLVRDDFIGDPIEEDLKVWANSELGKAIIENDAVALARLGISPAQMTTLHDIFDANPITAEQ